LNDRFTFECSRAGRRKQNGSNGGRISQEKEHIVRLCQRQFGSADHCNAKGLERKRFRCGSIVSDDRMSNGLQTFSDRSPQ
jgi:hypothetical protein